MVLVLWELRFVVCVFQVGGSGGVFARANRRVRLRARALHVYYTVLQHIRVNQVARPHVRHPWVFISRACASARCSGIFEYALTVKHLSRRVRRVRRDDDDDDDGDGDDIVAYVVFGCCVHVLYFVSRVGRFVLCIKLCCTLC